MFVSPKIKTVKIGEMLHSKIVRRAFFSAEMKNPAVILRENVCRAFCFFLLNSNCQMRKCPPCKIVRSKWKTNLSKYRKPVICRAVMVAHNGRNYMQLGIAGCFHVKPRNRFCGLRTFLSARKPQLTYSFC